MMADHVRKQIRDAVATGLTGLATTGDRVYRGRGRPLKAQHEPALLIYTRTETSERTVHGTPGKIRRTCTLHVEGRVSTADEPDDLLDQIAVEVEAAMTALIDFGANQVLGGLALSLQFTGTEMIADAEGERHIGGIRFNYLVTYRTVEGAATVAA